MVVPQYDKDAPSGQFREKLNRLQKLQLAKAKPIKENIAIYQKYLVAATALKNKQQVGNLRFTLMKPYTTRTHRLHIQPIILG